MLWATRAEWTRLQRRMFRFGWPAIAAAVTAMFVTIIFQAAGSGTPIPAAAPGGAFPSLADLTGPRGFIVGLEATSTILGVVTLSFWAVAVASDYANGLIRLLVQAQPRRLRLLAGKVAALTGLTAIIAAVATLVVVLVAPVAARASGIDTSAWSMTPGAVVEEVVRSWLGTFLALEVWGIIGLVIATLTKSSAIAIAAGVSYVLVIEGMVRMVASEIADVLPGATLTAIVSGGSSSITYEASIALGVAYGSIGLVIAGVTLVRRDIVD